MKLILICLVGAFAMAATAILLVCCIAADDRKD